MTKIAITGTNKIHNEIFLYSMLDSILPKGAYILTGGGEGTKNQIIKYCKKRNIEHKEYKDEQFNNYDKPKSYRNRQLAKDCDQYIAIWDNYSAGTKHMIKMAKRYGKLEMTIEM